MVDEIVARHHLRNIIEAKNDLKANSFQDAAAYLEEAMDEINSLPDPEGRKPEDRASFYNFCPFGCGELGKTDRILLQPEKFGDGNGLTYLCLCCRRIFTLDEDGVEKLEGEEDLPQAKIQSRFDRINEKAQTCPTCEQIFVPGIRPHGNCSEACYKREIGELEEEVTSN
jgi:hypothetical protein